ncbi:subtilisin SUB6 [Besnoitia besnoiti]|uniref:subtilisin n=1 Tax=Besnoitia besnoiti TaxID=94643 RepID=A0A2A9MHY8_BESBE|nr:subtilisin SUB6 [Besnoitia besnoiti]PFH38158.1 subtilisin SUB6 [Besnoitia besnoiti]
MSPWLLLFPLLILLLGPFQECAGEGYMKNHGNSTRDQDPGIDPRETMLGDETVSSREHLRRTLCKKYYTIVLGMHPSFNVDKLDCDHRPGPEIERIIESSGELKMMDPAQARQDRIEALKRLQKEAEASPTDRVIVEWDTACLKDLPSRMAEFMANEYGGSVSVFDEYELHDSSERIVLKRGVYFRDRIGVKDKTDPEVRQVLKGREYALGIIASTLGLEVWGPGSGAPCEGACRKALQSAMLAKDVPTLEAAHYSRLGVDVLHLKNLKKHKEIWGIKKAAEIPSVILRLAETRETSSATPDGRYLAASAREATSCILKMSDDQKREVQTPAAGRRHTQISGGNAIADDFVVAVLDTGCFIHQDFIDGFDIENSRFWINKGETDCENRIDDDGNGYVDDCFGWDFVGDQAYPFVDDLGHGTSVTSVLAARHGSNAGGRGIMSTGKVMCLRVGGRNGIWLSDTIPALDYALRMGAKVSNHSYGGKGFDQAEFTAFRRASQADHLAVTAAGNSGCDVDSDETCLFTPGAFDLEGILNVGANDVAGHRAVFSNYGKHAVDVFAPGQSIFVGTNKMPNQVEKTCKYCYEFIDGTSFAAPMVSGMAAALWTHFEITQPIGWVRNTKKKSMRVKEAIMYSVTGSRGVAGAGQVNGVVNFYKALHYYDTIPSVYKAEFPDPNGGYQAQGVAAETLSGAWRSSMRTLLALCATFAQHTWFLASP